jgi:hypothetical protein
MKIERIEDGPSWTGAAKVVHDKDWDEGDEGNEVSNRYKHTETCDR